MTTQKVTSWGFNIAALEQSKGGDCASYITNCGHLRAVKLMFPRFKVWYSCVFVFYLFIFGLSIVSDLTFCLIFGTRKVKNIKEQTIMGWRSCVRVKAEPASVFFIQNNLNLARKILNYTITVPGHFRTRLSVEFWCLSAICFSQLFSYCHYRWCKKINWSSKKFSKRATSIQSVRELAIWPTASCHWISHLIFTALRMSAETNKDGV